MAVTKPTGDNASKVAGLSSLRLKQQLESAENDEGTQTVAECIHHPGKCDAQEGRAPRPRPRTDRRR